MKPDREWKWHEVTDPKIIAETIWMADRPRTWREWFLMVFGDFFR
jgi:hypothetical protein